ncbi:MAG: hypothetical protein DRP74_01925 [Candidatus Omnitrophota bacterium]|nr:MAG: hypothetical protein DRP74_01925 [Candidatus Omnitrophota bacterium]
MKDHRVLYITYDGILEPIAQSQALNYIKGIGREGFKFYLMSFEKKAYINELDYLSEVKSDLDHNNISWIRLKYHRWPKIFSTFFDILAGIFVSLFICLKYKIRVIHARAEVAAFIAYVVSRLLGTRFIYDRRGVMAHDYIAGGMWTKTSPVTKILFKIVDSLDKKFLFKSDFTVVLTQRIAAFLKEDLLLRKREINLKVIPCCVDLQRFKPKQSNNPSVRASVSNKEFVLIYTGSIGTWYLLEEMVDFFNELKKVRMNARLLIVTHSERDLVEETLKLKRMDNESFAIDLKRYQEMPGCLNSADAAIMFIKPVFSKIASCPTKFGEYLACGLPVIVNTGIGDTRELIEKYRIGSVVDNFSAASYKKAVNELLFLVDNDKGLRERCREVAGKNLSLEYGMQSYLDIYKKLFDNSRGFGRG